MKFLTRTAFIPLYKKIYEDLKGRIQAGEFAPGQRLPYERELCQHYGVERVTVRKSLDLLAEDGLIDKRMGLGSFVKEKVSHLQGREERAAAAASAETGASILFVMRQNQNDIYHNTSSCNTKLFFIMEQLCREKGYLLSYVGLDGQRGLADIVRDHSVDGVFLVSSYQEQAIDDAVALSLPTVMLNHQDARLLSVMPDNAGMLRQVIGHLAEMGHKRIAYINGMPDSRNAQERWEGFKIAMYLNGLTVDPALNYTGNWTYEGGMAAGRELLQAKERPTAVFAASDMMAAGAMEVFKQQGVLVPDEISVIGYDNLDVDEMLTPQLSSATVDFNQMCTIAFECLNRLMKTGDRKIDHYTIRMPVTLISRNSVAKKNQQK